MGEIDIYGVIVPVLLIAGLFALLITLLAGRLMDRFGLYRFIWHRALFDLAIFVIALGALLQIPVGVTHPYVGLPATAASEDTPS